MCGIELCARFSYVTNKLEYCGPKSCTSVIFDYLNGDSNLKDKVKEDLEKFEGLMPYFDVMSKRTGKYPFSKEVTEAYWIGNSLLDEFSKEDMVQIINNLVERGLPKFLADKLIEKLPEGFFPHHAFNVIFVGVGQLTGSVATNIENMDKCRITAGKVLEIKDNKLVISFEELKMDDKLYFERSIKEVDYNFITPKIGDIVAVHWNRAVMILKEEQKNNLEKYTQKIIKVVNS